MRTWMASNVASDDGRSLLRTIIEVTFAASVNELSLLHVLFGIRAANGTTSMFGGPGCAQDSTISGGAHGPWGSLNGY
jgi:monoamine oxidase